MTSTKQASTENKQLRLLCSVYLEGPLTRSVLCVAPACLAARFPLWLNGYIVRDAVFSQQTSVKDITARAFFASTRRTRLSSLPTSPVFPRETVRRPFFSFWTVSRRGSFSPKTSCFSPRTIWANVTQLVVLWLAAPDSDPPPLSVFAHFQTMCPGLCVRYTTVLITTNNKVRGIRQSPPLRALWLWLGPWQGGSTTPSGRLHRGCLLAAAAAAPALPTCCSTQAVLLVLTATALVIGVLRGV